MTFRQKQNSLGFKVSLSFGLVGLILIGALLFTIVEVQRIDDVTYRLSGYNAELLHTSARSINELNRDLQQQRAALLANDKQAFSQQQSLSQQKIQTTTKLLAQLILTSKDKFTQQNVIEIIDNLQRSNQAQKDVAAMLEKKGTSAALVLLNQQADPLLNELFDDFRQLLNTRSNLVMAGLQKVQGHVNRLLYSDWGFLILGLLMCGLLGMILTKFITGPIYRLVGIAKNLSRGDLKQDINIGETTEFERLSQALNDMVQTFQNLSDITQSMAMGDYSERVKVKSSEDNLAISVNQMLDNLNQIVQQANSIAEGDYSSDITPRSDRDMLGAALQNMTKTLSENKRHNDQGNWLKDGLAELTSEISGSTDIPTLCNIAINTICRYVNAGVGVIFIYDINQQNLHLISSFAFQQRQNIPNEFSLGEGIVGQVALEKKAILLTGASDDEINIATGTSNQKPRGIYTFPLVHENTLIGVIEISTHGTFSQQQFDYFKQLSPLLAIQIQSAHQQTLTSKLLNDSKLLTHQLQSQQEKLKLTNEELAQQAEVLKRSEENLKLKDEQQQAASKQLAERTKLIEKQKVETEEKNVALQNIQKALKQKAAELESTNKYKSEFLANMSHELRTPLNSLLILAKLLSENNEGNLDAGQLESANIMYKSGQDLLMLINDILDLAKVEAGKIELNFTNTSLSYFTENIKRSFTAVTKEKGIDLIVQIDPGLPEQILTDDHRVEQIIRNLIANAIKFTENGHVKFRISYPESDVTFQNKQLIPKAAIAFSVEDTGIGIPEEKQHLIFESFQQADGTTSRRYGGTGLGLSISTQLAALLGGEINLQSTVNQGSTFTLYLPEKTPKQEKTITRKRTESISTPALTQKETNKPAKKRSVILMDKKILIVDDDMRNTFALSKLLSSTGMDVIMAANGKTAIETLKSQKDIDVVLMDIMMPVMDGYEAITKIRENKTFNKLPIIALTAKVMTGDSEKCIAVGASDFLAKPIEPEKLILLLEKHLENNTEVRKS